MDAKTTQTFRPIAVHDTIEGAFSAEGAACPFVELMDGS
jgi:hypothetical protein